MTTAIKINPNDGKVQITATGGETTLNFDFPIFDATHIRVLEKTTAGVEIVLIKDIDYTVPLASLNVQGGGTVELTAASYPSGATVGNVFTLLLNVPDARVTDFTIAGDFLAQTLNKELDLFAEMIQQLRRDFDRCFKLPETTPIANALIAEPSSAVDGYSAFWNDTSQQLDFKVIQLAGSFVNPLTTTGDIIVQGSGGSPERLALGSQNHVIRTNAAGTARETGLVDSDNIATNAIKAPKLGLNNFHGALPPDFIIKWATAATVDIDWTKGGLSVSDGDNIDYIKKGNFTADVTASGVNGLDTGTEATSVFYYIYIILNPLPISNGTTDSTTSGKLEDSTADFVTDGVKIGDLVRNTTDETETYVTAVDDLNTLSLADDIFVSGETYNIIQVASLLSESPTAPTLPSGYTFSRIVGAVLNNSSSNFVRFHQQGQVVSLYEATPISANNPSAATFTEQGLSPSMPCAIARIAHLNVIGIGTGSAGNSHVLQVKSGDGDASSSDSIDAVYLSIVVTSQMHRNSNSVLVAVPDTGAIFYRWTTIAPTTPSIQFEVIGFQLMV